MIYLIYSVYLDSILFLRKKLFVLLPYYVLLIVTSVFEKYFNSNFLLKDFISFFIEFFLLIFLEIFTTVLVCKHTIFSSHEYPFWTMLKHYYERGLFLFVSTLFFLILFGVVLAIFAPAIGRFGYTLSTISCMFICTLSLQYMVVYNKDSIRDSLKGGVASLYKDFIFYFLVLLVGILINKFPSLLFPSSWLFLPILSIAEIEFILSPVTWLSWLIYPVLNSLQFISITLAFIYKHNKWNS